MKISILIFIHVIAVEGVFAQDSVNQAKVGNIFDEVVINTKMIESFINYEYSECTLSTFDVLCLYSFDQARVILNGYWKNEINLTETEIESYIKSNLYHKYAVKNSAGAEDSISSRLIN